MGLDCAEVDPYSRHRSYGYALFACPKLLLSFPFPSRRLPPGSRDGRSYQLAGLV